MTGVNDRVVQTPCGWCGRAIAQSGKGRRRLYCDRSCRQRAYEVRTAHARLDEARTAGDVLPVPAVRIVERVVQAGYPSTSTGWVKALDELAARVREGRIEQPHVGRLLDATIGLLAELERPPAERPAAFADTQPGPGVGSPLRMPEIYVESPQGWIVPSTEAGVAISRLLDLARTDDQPARHTTLQVLGRQIDTDPESVREALWFLCENHYATLMRDGRPADLGSIATHNRITLFLSAAPLA